MIDGSGKCMCNVRHRSPWASAPAAGHAGEARAARPSARAKAPAHAHDGAVGELNQSIRLSPNYAFAHYSLAFVQCQTGDSGCAIDAADIAAARRCVLESVYDAEAH